MTNNGFVKVNRNILNWRWYGDDNTFRVFFHLLLKANYQDGEFEIHTIKRGQLVTGRKALAKELNISERQVRTALDHLKTTNEIAITPTSKYSIITINSYDKYQSVTNTSTNDRPTNDQQPTNNQQQYKKNKKDKNKRKQEYSADAQERNASYSLEDFESKSLFTD